MSGTQRRLVTAWAAVAVTVALASCSGSAAGSVSTIEPSPTRAAAPTAPPSAELVSGDADSPVPATPGLPAAPPAATLLGLAGGTHAAGSLGSYTWSGGGSDAPWLVSQPVGMTGAAAQLRVTFETLEAGTWSAAWAKVVDGAAAKPVGGASGSGAIAITAPSAGGDWSLRVTATFGPGANATWFWRITVSP